MDKNPVLSISLVLRLVSTFDKSNSLKRPSIDTKSDEPVGEVLIIDPSQNLASE